MAKAEKHVFLEYGSTFSAVCAEEPVNTTRSRLIYVESEGCKIPGLTTGDLLYSVNWLPIGFAYAYYATGDEWFRTLWKDIVRFCLKTQIISDDPRTDGSWCRAFDMDLGEAYGCPP